MSDVIHWQELTPEQRDTLVAEKVMGDTYTCRAMLERTVHENPSRAGGIAFSYTTWQCPVCGARGFGSEELPEHKKPIRIPYYTTSLDTVWLVIQKMAEKQSDDISFPSIDAWFQTFLFGVKIWKMPPDKAADLICRGALELQGWKDGYKVVD